MKNDTNTDQNQEHDNTTVTNIPEKKTREQQNAELLRLINESGEKNIKILREITTSYINGYSEQPEKPFSIIEFL
ncbi:MAG: hypothetical protein HKK67_09055 [Chlorobiaceae bacterium]|nr:hypothetical protein [Chlorobiaceae bacterium]